VLLYNELIQCTSRKIN